MKWSIPIATAALALFATDASAQVDLTGRFQCVQSCRPEFAGGLAFVTQNGWQMNMVDDTGRSSRAWIDWPGHIWAENWSEGAIYSPDGNTIQFDHGQVWQRAIELPPPEPEPVVVRKRRVR
jgi:hypothetical protein